MLRKDVNYGALAKGGNYVGETAKAKNRRLKEKWFQQFIRKPGIDIGCGVDPVDPEFHMWDVLYGDGDANYMDGVPDDYYKTVYSSHILEHMEDPVEAVRNWWRILSPGGYLIVLVPHRDLYEKRKELPSLWNGDHKTFWLPSASEPPCTHSLVHVIGEATGKEKVLVRTLDAGYVDHGPDRQPGGEYSIEAILRK